MLNLASNPEPFAILYTLGNLVSIAGTLFLWGPCGQCKKMWECHRIGATLTYWIMMGVTLWVAIDVKNAALTLLCIFVQFCAMVYYSASYIPYGRKILKKILNWVCCNFD